MLDDKELKWLNDYHQRVYDTLAPKLDAGEKAWLKQATAPLKKNEPPALRLSLPGHPLKFDCHPGAG